MPRAVRHFDSSGRIALRRGGAPSMMALEALREACTGSLQGKAVLIKPNVGFVAPPAGGVVTHPEVVRGVIWFCREMGARSVSVGESSIYGVDTDQAMGSCGLAPVAEEEGVPLVNLDRGKAVTLRVPSPTALDKLRVSSLALEADLIVSVPVMKTHMHAGATLSIKNMKGCLLGGEKRRFHHLKEEDRFGPWSDFKTLDRAIADFFSVFPPQIAVIDGVIAMEGLGPMLGEPKPLGLVLASEDSLVADLAALHIMGLAPAQVPHVLLCARQRGFAWDGVGQLNLDHEAVARARSPFKIALPEDVSDQFPHFHLVEGQSCSACQATAMAFLKIYGARFVQGERVTIAMGKGLIRKDAQRGAILLGNCTAKLRKEGVFLEGCPPVPSDILRALESLVKIQT